MSGTESFAVDLIDAGVLDDVAPETGKRDTDVTIEARLVVSGAAGTLAEATTSDVATVSVTRESVDASEYGHVGGSGSLTIETE